MGTTAPVASTGPPRDHRPEAKIPVVRALGLPVVRPDVPHAPRRRRCVGGLHPLAAPGAFPVPFRLARRDAEQTAAAYLKESGRLTGPLNEHTWGDQNRNGQSSYINGPDENRPHGGIESAISLSEHYLSSGQAKTIHRGEKISSKWTTSRYKVTTAKMQSADFVTLKSQKEKGGTLFQSEDGTHRNNSI